MAVLNRPKAVYFVVAVGSFAFLSGCSETKTDQTALKAMMGRMGISSASDLQCITAKAGPIDVPKVQEGAKSLFAKTGLLSGNLDYDAEEATSAEKSYFKLLRTMMQCAPKKMITKKIEDGDYSSYTLTKTQAECLSLGVVRTQSSLPDVEFRKSMSGGLETWSEKGLENLAKELKKCDVPDEAIEFVIGR